MFTRSTLFILVAALAAGLGLWAGQSWLAPPAPAGIAGMDLRAVRAFPAPRAVPAFSLRQSDGTPLTADELRGHWTLVFLGFTHCPDVCPTTLGDLARAQKQWQSLPAATRPRLLFVSVDPDRDTPGRTGEYARYFHPETLAATAGEPALSQFATSLGLVYMKVPGAGDGYSMDHSSALVLLDPQGRQAGLVRPPFVAEDIAADLARLAKVQP